jgi:hypothetical protein
MTDLILNAFTWTAEHRSAYLSAIEKRPSGSQWGGDGFMPWQQLATLPWQPLPKADYCQGLHLPSCDYFFLQDFDLGGATQAFRLLSDFEDYSSIELRQGSHGAELVSHLVRPVSTKEAWLILGQASYQDGQVVPNQKMVWAAYPGQMTASIKHIPKFDGSLPSLVQAARQGVKIAVKGVSV